MSNMSLKICNRDRIGLVFDVSAILIKQNINILSMEVQPNTIYLEVQSLNDAHKENNIRSLLENIPHVQKVIDFPYPSKKAQTIILTDNSLFDCIIHHNKQMSNSIELAKKIAPSQVTVLLRGESGTGKEMFAKAIHSASHRCNGPFIAINCATLPDNLLESELFGYDDGAFTGAKKYGKQGLFENANGGTIFLDEIGELPLQLQAKLLRVLQEKTIRRIGSHREIAVDIRVIAATNCHLEEMIMAKKFREDLYYRLNVIPITLSPLRMRKDDLPLLIEHIIKKRCDHQHIETKMVSESAMQKLCQHDWPGNIRELENVLERALCFSSNDVIVLDDILIDTPTQNKVTIINELNNTMFERRLKESLDELEYKILSQTIKKYGSSRQVGRVLGLSHTGVLNRIKKYKINYPL